MKIGLVCPYNIAKGGGVQEIVFAMQKELTRRGHDVYVITPEPRECKDGGCEFRPKTIFVGTGAQFATPIHTTGQVSAGLNEKIDEVLEEYKFDILHFHEPAVPLLSRQILSRSLQAGTVNIGTFHAAFPETAAGRTFATVVIPYTKPILKYLHELTAVSDAAAEYVCKLTTRPVAMIPNGVDVETYKPPLKIDESKKNKTIFYVGRLEQRKGVKYLLRAFKVLSETRPAVSLVIAGDGPDRDRLEILAADLGIEGKVKFTGYITNKRKIQYMQKSDMACFPALYGESFGVVLLEAMACGLVTVAGNNPGYANVMQNLGALSVVDPKDSREFARRLDLLLHEKALRALWRDWARKEIRKYTYENVVSQYEELYKEALKKHGR
jgi:phosphatidyl-myo-inositol alpha-mannosyltransferase